LVGDARVTSARCQRLSAARVHHPYYVYNFLGIKPEQMFVSSEQLKPGKYTLGTEFTRTGAGPHKESSGTTKLYINDTVVAEGPMKTQPAKFTLSGDGLCVGYDSGDAVSGEYKVPGTFHGGTILGVGITVEEQSYEALEEEAAEGDDGRLTSAHAIANVSSALRDLAT